MPHPDLQTVHRFFAREGSAIDAITDKLECVTRMLAAQNAKTGRPFDVHDLADLTQDVTMIVLRKLRTYEGRSPLEGWIYRVCQWEFMNGLRHKRRTPRPVADDVIESIPDAEAPRMDANERIERALQRVGGVEAELISLKHFEGLTFEELGERLAIPTSTAKTRYYRGMVRLERILRKGRS